MPLTIDKLLAGYRSRAFSRPAPEAENWFKEQLKLIIEDEVEKRLKKN